MKNSKDSESGEEPRMGCSHWAVRGEETRKAREHVYWICRPGEGIRHSVKKNGDGNVALAGSDDGGNI